MLLWWLHFLSWLMCDFMGCYYYVLRDYYEFFSHFFLTQKGVWLRGWREEQFPSYIKRYAWHQEKPLPSTGILEPGDQQSSHRGFWMQERWKTFCLGLQILTHYLTDSAQEIKHSMLLSGWFWSQAIPSTASASISIRDTLSFCTALVTLLFLVCSTGSSMVCP